MRISSNTRWARAGAQSGDAIIETVHGMYLRDNALQYLQALRLKLDIEFERRVRDFVENPPPPRKRMKNASSKSD